jgi:hypothetical protein
VGFLANFYLKINTMLDILEDNAQCEYVCGREDALALTYIGEEILRTYKKVRVDKNTVILVKKK